MKALVLLFAIALAASARASGPVVFINEFHYDNASTDAGEFIELAGPAGTDLAGWSLVLYNGATGAPYGDTLTLSGVLSDEQNGFGFVAFDAVGLQNGAPDGIALLNPTTVVQFLSYEGAFEATSGPALGMTSVNVGVAELGTDPMGSSLQLQGSGRSYDDFTWAGPLTETPGLVNVGQTFLIPEPQTYAMLLAGLGLLGFAARRRLKR